MKNLDLNPIVIHGWSRTHSGATNYCLIEQHIIYKFNHKHAIKLSPDNTSKELAQYEVESLPKESNILSFKYLEEDAMNKTNVATNKYDYFLINFVNGTKIICKTYKEFIEIIENT